MTPGQNISMRAKAFMIAVACVCALAFGCASDRQRSELGPVGFPPDFHRQHDPALSKRDREVIAAARYHIEKLLGRPVDAYYRIRQTSDGYRVVVAPVAGYDGIMPEFIFSHHIVCLRKDKTLIRIEGGL